MEIIAQGANLLERWQRDQTVIDAEITVGHVGMTFTGRVSYVSGTELVLSHAEGELSISLFCSGYTVIEPKAKDQQSAHWVKFRRVVQITTDGGAVCTLHERRTETAE